MKRTLVGIIIAVPMLAALLVTSVQTAGASTGGKISVWVTPNVTGATDKILVVGAIGDYGVATSVNLNGKVNANGNYAIVKLQKESFWVNLTQFNKAGNNAPPTINDAATCSFAFVASAPITVFNGEGAYKGVKGTLQGSQQVLAIGPRVKSGKHKGQCNLANSAQPLAFGGGVSVTGSISYS